MFGVFDFNNKSDLEYIFAGILILETLMIFVVRYYPSTFRMLDKWYNQFGWLAVGLDFVSMAIAFVLARWVLKRWFPESTNSVIHFILIIIAIQMIHDILFHFLVIKPLPKGHNRVIDLFKSYADENGALILFGDAFIVLMSLMFALIMKNNFPETTIEISLVVLYALMYVMGNFGTPR